MNLPLKTTKKLLLLLFFAVLIRTAWVADDAFFTLRTVDNFVNGYGLRWNILERVQVYTHPLWMFLLSGVYYFIRNPLITSYILTVFVSIITVYLFSAKFTKSYIQLFFGFTILLFSKAFIDYSTSGLENPLTHFLLVIFLGLFFDYKRFTSKQGFLLFFIASLVTINRMDTFLILAPSLLYVLFKNRDAQTIVYAGLGFFPFILWELFSLLYYGFPFPNTAYAKLAMGIDKSLLIQQGYRYFLDSFQRDPITLIVILLSILVTFIRNNKSKDQVVAIGMLLYLFYIVQIGGDFMAGRFFSALLLISTIILIRAINFRKMSKQKLIAIFASLIILRAFAISPYSLGSANRDGIHDERVAYFAITSIQSINPNTLRPDYLWVYQGLEHKEKGRQLSIGPSSGMFAFYAGTGLHVVDTHGLGDPLVSRLPAIEQEEVLVGHYFRAVPAGYWKYPRSFGNEIEDENLRKYYEKLSVLTRQKNLFTLNRFILIWRMNTGYYDYLIDAYLADIEKSK